MASEIAITLCQVNGNYQWNTLWDLNLAKGLLDHYVIKLCLFYSYGDASSFYSKIQNWRFLWGFMVCPFAHDSFALIAYIELVNADAPCDKSYDFFFFFFSSMHLIGWDTHSRFIKEGMTSWNFTTTFQGQPSVTSRGSVQTPSRAIFFFSPSV